jgi:hypothetical protein
MEIVKETKTDIQALVSQMTDDELVLLQAKVTQEVTRRKDKEKNEVIEETCRLLKKLDGILTYNIELECETVDGCGIEEVEIDLICLAEKLKLYKS